MKVVLLVLLISIVSSAQGQSKNTLYRTQVTMHSGVKTVGVLTLLGDSSLQFVPLAQFSKGQLNEEPVFHLYAIKDIYLLQIRKKGALASTAIIGGVVGLAVGAVIGWFTYQDPCANSTGGWGCLEIFDQKDTMFAAGSLGGVIGAGVGALAGSSNKKYYLRGDFENYRQMRSELSQYVYPLPFSTQTK